MKNWLKRLWHTNPRSASFRRRRLPLGVEALEDRTVPATIAVTTAANVVSGDADLSSLAALQVTPGSDGQISLREAILAANANQDADTIQLQAFTTYSFNTIDNFWYGRNALPAISSPITIEGNGATLARDGEFSGALRFFYVAWGVSGLPEGNLVVRDLTLSNGLARGGDSNLGGGGMGAGGAIFNQGTVVLERVTLTNNTAQGGSSGVTVLGVAGGGIGSNSSTSEGAEGGGFGGAAPGAMGGSGSGNGGGGGGFRGNDNSVNPNGGGTGGLGGQGGSPTGGGGSAGDGGGGAGALGAGAPGGNFGAGGQSNQSSNGTGGGGGIGGGGGGGGAGGGGGGFGGGGGAATVDGSGGFGGFGAGGGRFTEGGGNGGFGGGNANTTIGGGGAGMGGAIFNHEGTLTLINSTVSGNRARGGDGANGGQGLGGGVFNLNGTVSFVQSTLAGNTVQSGTGGTPSEPDGGAVYSVSFGTDVITTFAAIEAVSARLTLLNALLADSTDGTNTVNDLVTQRVNGTHNLDRNTALVENSIQGGTVTGSAFLAVDPQLEPLGDNGGLTFTHAFPSGSPAHNSGSDGDANDAGVTTDQRGLERFVGQVDLGSFELQAPALSANYTWDNAANTLHISLNSGQSLTVSESGGVVTFMVDTGVFAHDVGDTATGDTTDTLMFDAADLIVSVMIDNSIADTGTNNVTFSGAGSLSAQTVSVNLSDPESLGIISFTGGFDVATTTGGLSLTTPRNISIGTDSVLSTTDGAITLSANQQLTPSTGTFVGIEVVGTVQSTGAGAINLTGRGGTAGNFNPGVRVNNGGLVTSATGAIALTGQGGASPAGAANAGVSLLNGQVSSTGTGDDAAPITVQGTGGSGTNNNNGVLLQGSTALITSVAGDIAITGQAGPGTGGSNYGVSIQSGGVIASTGTGAGAARITINATGGSGNGSTGNQGFRIANGGSQLKSVDGAIQVTATAGFGADADIQLLSTNGLAVTGAAALTLIADRMELLPTPAIAAGTSTVTLKTRTANGSIGIDVGGADSATSLGLSNAELNRITAGQIVLGDSGSGDLTVSAAVALTSGANVELRSGGAIVFNPGSFATGGSLLLDPGSGPVRPTSTGVDATASAVSFAADLEIALNGTTVNTEYTQLNVSGTVDLTGADLTLTGAHVPAVGNTFIIVAATSRIGTFNDLPAGAVISFNGRLLQISYTSTQIVLTTFEVPSNLVVDSIGDVSDGNFSAGQLSLREAIELANLVSDANTIAFDATLFATPQTITLGGSALPNLTGDVTITGPAARVTLDANQQSRHLTVAAGATARLSNLTLTRGSAADEGGAIVNHGTLTLSDCAISNNATTGEGGGIANRGTLTLSRCTLSDNSAGSSGGGIHHKNAVMLTLTDCTLSGNTSAFSGGGIYIFNSPATLTNCTLNDNAALGNGFAGGAILNGGTSMLRLTNCTLSGNAAGSAGGAFFSNGTAILTNCTVVANESPNGGIALSGTVTLNNTLVAGNTTDGTTPSDIVRFGGTLTANNSLIGDPNTAGGLTTANGNILGNGSGGVLPLAQLIDLVLADNGGPTRTHALATGSRALNAGSNALAVDDMAVALAFDQRGTSFPRIVGDAVDIGAFEVQAAFSGGFDGPDGSDLGDDFILTSGRFTLMGGMAVAQGSKPAQATVEGDFSDVAIDLDVSLAGNGSRAGVIARYTPKQGSQPESYYWGRLIKQDGRTFAEILRYKNGVVKELGRVRVDLTGDAGQLRFEVFGSSLKLFVDGELMLSATDNGLSGPGLTGIRAKKGAGLDNLVVNELTATAVTLPFSDDFSTGSAGGTQLSLAWANRVGNVAVISGQGNQAVGNATTALATLNGLDTESVSVGAELFLLDQTGDVGLVTNFVRGPQGDSYYWARLARGAGGRVTLSIQKVKNGTATPLGGAVELPAFNFDTFHQLQFNADGGTLQVNLDNGQTVVNRTDATPLASGSVGLRVSQGNGYESFNAEDLM